MSTRTSTASHSRPGPARLLAAFLAVAFCSAVFSTNPSHCQDACEGCPAELTNAVGHLDCPDGSHAPELHAAAGEDAGVGTETCPGASCLCHQPRIPAALEVPRSATPYTLALVSAPARPPLEHADEILHIPKRAA